MGFQFKGSQWPYAALILVLLVAAGVSLFGMEFVADRQNQTSVATQQQIASSLTESLPASLASNVSAEAYWQAAYDATSEKWDQAWVDWEYGGYLRSLDVPVGILYSGKGTLKHLYKDGPAASIEDKVLTGDPQVRELLAQVLRSAPRTPPQVSQGFLTVGGKLFYGAAAYVTPEHGPMTSDKDRQSVLVFLREMAPSRYTAIAQYTHTDGFEVTGTAFEIPGKVSVPLLSVGGRVVARLWWMPYRPGAALLATMVPFALAVFAALGGVLFFILHKWKLSTAKALAAGALALAAQRESRAKSEFLGNVSHELRTPLNAIIGFSEFIKQELFGPVGVSKYREYAQHIHSSGLHLLRMVDDLLELVRLERKSAELSCVSSNALETIDAVLAMFEVEAQRKTIRLVRADEIPLVEAYFDRQALSRVLVNIVGNAMKFTAPGGEVSVYAVTNDDYLSIVVRDNGIGISAQDLPKLGQPFVQIGNHHHAKQHEGSGLGLAICKHLLATMHGRLTIDSEYGAGTVVTIALPRRKPVSGAASELTRAA